MKSKYTYIAVGIIVIALLLISPRFATQKQVATVPDPTVLQGMQITEGPWQPELAHLRERLQVMGLPALSAEGSALHIHQHLDIFVHGKALSVPAGIGINESAQFISDIHTHDGTGVIHVESPTIQSFTLGQFSDIWGVQFTATSLGGYTVDAVNSLKVFVDGKELTGDPRALVLGEKQEIAIVYGTAQEIPKTIPSTYAFEAGL